MGKKRAQWVDWYQYRDPFTGRVILKQADVSKSPIEIVEDEIIELRGDLVDGMEKILGKMNREIRDIKKEVASIKRNTLRQRKGSLLRRRAERGGEWTEERAKKYLDSISEGKEHKFTECVKKCEDAGFADDCKRFCAKVKDWAEGTTKWRKGRGEKRSSVMKGRRKGSLHRVLATLKKRDLRKKGSVLRDRDAYFDRLKKRASSKNNRVRLIAIPKKRATILNRNASRRARLIATKRRRRLLANKDNSQVRVIIRPKRAAKADEFTVTTSKGRKITVKTKRARLARRIKRAEQAPEYPYKDTNQQQNVMVPEPPKTPEQPQQVQPQTQKPNTNDTNKVSLYETIISQIAKIYGVDPQNVEIINVSATKPKSEEGIVITVSYRVGSNGAKKEAYVYASKKELVVKTANITTKVPFDGETVKYDIPTRTIITDDGKILTDDKEPELMVSDGDRKQAIPDGIREVAVESVITNTPTEINSPVVSVQASKKNDEFTKLATQITDTLIRKGILEPERRGEQIQFYLAKYSSARELKPILDILNRLDDGDTVYIDKDGIPTDLKEVF